MFVEEFSDSKPGKRTCVAPASRQANSVDPENFGFYFVIYFVILQADKFLKCDWLRPIVFKPNLKYLHVKSTPVT